MINKKSVIGIEVNSDKVTLTEVEKKEKAVVVTKFSEVQLDINVVKDNIIVDFLKLAKQLKQVLVEEKFSAKDIVVSMNNNLFLKRCELIKDSSTGNLVDTLENAVSESYLFLHDAFQLGYKSFIPLTKVSMNLNSQSTTSQSGNDHKTKNTVVYSAVSASAIHSIQQMALELDKNLTAIDLSPLAMLRAMLWQQKCSHKPQLTLIIDEQYIDLNIVYNGDILLSHVFRKKIDHVLENQSVASGYYQIIKQLLLSFQSRYPQLETPKTLIGFSRLNNAQLFLERLADELSIELKLYDVLSNTNFLVKTHDAKKNNYIAKTYLAAIGLAYKAFEPADKSLSFINEAAQSTPEKPKTNTLLYVVVVSSIIGLILALSGAITYQTAKLEDKLLTIQNNLVEQPVDVNYDQFTDILHMQNKIDLATTMQQSSNLKYNFLHQFVATMPTDIALRKLSISNQSGKEKIIIEAESYQLESIYIFYDMLKEAYFTVELKTITTTKDITNTDINQFTLELIKDDI